MNKQQIYDAFDGEVSKTAIRKVGDEWMLVGRYGFVAPVDDVWDVFVCNPADMTKGLSQRKVGAILVGIYNRVFDNVADVSSVSEIYGESWGLRILDGEAYMQALSVEQIKKVLDLLGIRRSMNLSEDARAKMAQRMRALREGKSAVDEWYVE